MENGIKMKLRIHDKLNVQQGTKRGVHVTCGVDFLWQ